MALSEVHNLAAIIGNNGFTVNKSNTVEPNINVLGLQNSYPQDRCNTEYNYWNYELTQCHTQTNMSVEDEDSQDLNNPMVTDLVSKILDDDSVINDSTHNNNYNGATQYHSEAQSCIMQKDNNFDNCLVNMEHLNVQYPFNKLETIVPNDVNLEHNYSNSLCGEFKALNLNTCIGEVHDQGNLYNNGIVTYQNSYPSNSQSYMSHTSNENFGVTGNNVSQCSDLLTMTNESNPCKQSTNWSENLLNPESTAGVFRNYHQMENGMNPDFNFNVALTLALDSPDPIILSDLEYHGNIGQNATTNSYSNPTTTTHDLYNVTGNNQSYRPSSAMTDLSVDSGFLSNSPLQHFSPADTTLQNCFANNVQRSGARDYKELHESNRLGAGNMSIPNDQFPFLQQQTQSYKLDQAVDQNCKHLTDYYPGINDFTASSTNNLDTNDNIRPLGNNNSVDNNLLKIISPKSKTIETKTYSPIGFPKNLSSRTSRPSIAKYGYHNYHHYTASNSETLKMLPQSSTSYHNDSKQPNSTNSYKIEGFDMTKEIAFPSMRHLTNQIAGSSVNKDTFNYFMKRHQMPRIQDSPGIRSADVIFKSGILSRPNTVQSSGVFPTVMPVPLALTVPCLFSAIYGGSLSLRNGTGLARRTGPSSILHFRLEQTYEQFKQLEKERKKCEAMLAAHFPGKRVTSANNISIPRRQGNPSRVDRLIIDYLREHACVITLIAKMERLRGTTINQRVHRAMEYWLETIKFVQKCRKREIANATKRQRENPSCILIYNDNDILILAASVYELTKASRYARSGMYNALQATLLYNFDIEQSVVETSQDPILVIKRNENQTATDVDDYANCI